LRAEKLGIGEGAQPPRRLSGALEGAAGIELGYFRLPALRHPVGALDDEAEKPPIVGLEPEPARHPALREAPLTRVEVHVPMEGTLGRAGHEPERQRNVAEPMKCLETVDETTELGEGGHASDYVSSTEIARPSTARRTASTINGAAMLFLALI